MHQKIVRVHSAFKPRPSSYLLWEKDRGLLVEVKTKTGRRYARGKGLTQGREGWAECEGREDKPRLPVKFDIATGDFFFREEYRSLIEHRKIDRAEERRLLKKQIDVRYHARLNGSETSRIHSSNERSVAEGVLLKPIPV